MFYEFKKCEQDIAEWQAKGAKYFYVGILKI